jgi:serine/threonine-protein kinase
VKQCAVCSINYPDALEFCPRDGNKLPPPPGGTQALYDPLLGSTIDGRYVIEALLGQGGMGFVYAARHAIIDKRVAIKVLRKEAAQDETAAQRFIAEAKAASKIGHQNIVDITDFGVLPDGHAYFVMEYLDGPTLAMLVQQLGQLPPLRAIGITVQIARGLHAAHNKSIIHRDLKPENVFVLERDGTPDVVKIVDFGIAKDAKSGRRLTQIGMVLGTPEYMSPEQATGQPTDHRVDMYALGCILYEMLVGDVPFKGENSTKTLTKHVFELPVPPSQRRPDLNVPPALEAVVMRTIQKKPADRYADLRELMGELDRVEADLRVGRLGPAPTPARAAAPSPTAVTAPPLAAPTVQTSQVDDDLVPARRRGPLYVALGGVGAAALVGLLVAVSHGGSKPRPAQAALSPIVAPKAPVTATAAPAAQPEDVEIVLRTVPPGAEIFEGAELVGTSPLPLRRPRSESPLGFTIKRAGYLAVSREVVPSKDRDVEVVLVARPHDKVATARRPAPPTPQASQPPPPRNVSQPKRVSDLRNPFE